MESANASNVGDGLPHHPTPQAGQFAILDILIPGFSVFSSAIHAYLGIDLNLYIPLLLVISGLTVAWTYMSDYVWSMIEKYMMSVVRIRTDDEIYNIIMAWVATQRFAQGSRRFIVNTNINSRCWFLFRYRDDDDDEYETEEGSNGLTPRKKPLQYTPSFGTHFFWYKGSLLLFERHENREQSAFLVVSEREEISISCFGRNPRVLKELLLEARQQYMKKDEKKTLIYRGAASSSGGEPTWQRCMTRANRPISTVILSEKVKKDLIDDVTDYLNPATRRWYSNRGIPYRRGYLLYGPPGTGKSSLSLALAGFFRMRIYMVSLSSIMANEENLSSLFAELPRRCVVLLEDIDSAGLTHTREDGKGEDNVQSPVVPAPSSPGKGNGTNTATLPGRLSLSGLLNILDGVASQEGRVLIMTTNHLEKLDKALIRPGRVDMIVKFGLADAEMTSSIFRAIYAPYEGEDVRGPPGLTRKATGLLLDEAEAKKEAELVAKTRAETLERISGMAAEFAAKIPEHEFSPAEIQGLLLKHKRNPEKVIELADEWVVNTRKEKKQKEIEDAEKKRKDEEKRKKEEAKKKRKEERAKARKKAKKAAKRKSKPEGDVSDSGSGSGSGSGSDSDESESESEAEAKAKDEVKDNTNDNKTKNSDATETTEKPDESKSEDKPQKSPSDSGYDTPEPTI